MSVEHIGRPIVNKDPPLWAAGKGDPVLAPVHGIPGRHEEGAHFVSGKRPAEKGGIPSVNNNAGDPRSPHLLGGRQLGGHPAGSDRRSATAGCLLQLPGYAPNQWDEAGVGVGPGVLVVQPLNIGQNDQEMGLGQIGHQGREVVIVAEFDLLHDHCVVLVDDRNDPAIEEGVQGRAGVQETLAVGQIVTGEEYLGDFLVMGSEGLLVGVHELELADSRRRLLLGNGARPSGEPQVLPPRGHRPG